MVGNRGSAGLKAKTVVRFLGAGLELAGISGLFAVGGWAIDRWQDSGRTATALGLLIGFSLGMFRFVLMALRATSESDGSID